MLTAAGSLTDRVEGLNLGADDYLPKPFDFPELTARVRALGRRTADPVPPVLTHAGIRLDQESHGGGNVLRSANPTDHGAVAH